MFAINTSLQFPSPQFDGTQSSCELRRTVTHLKIYALYQAPHQVPLRRLQQVLMTIQMSA